jgi:hypothetical protein
MKSNQSKLVMQAIQGRVHHPVMRAPGYRIGSDGVPWIVPATASITYNCQIGDYCMGLVGDHVEPGVSVKNSDPLEDSAFNVFACVGNVAKVVSGDAKGALGIVTGKHGGADHVMCWFAQETLEQLNIDDKIMIKAYGTGLQLSDYPQIKCMNLDPELLKKLPIVEQNGYLEVGVTHIIPAYLMGSGLGSSTMQSGDYDIMTRDLTSYEALKLETLRFGDLVFISDHYNGYGPDYRLGAGTLGIVIHGDSAISGHGPGVTVLMTAKDQSLRPVINDQANLKKYL